MQITLFTQIFFLYHFTLLCIIFGISRNLYPLICTFPNLLIDRPLKIKKRTVGIGAGQMSRIDSVKIATFKSLPDPKGTVMASDAFFPFRDGIDEAAKVGVTAVIQPGGSVRDQEVIDAADEHNIAMIFTGMRHFKH